jgi:serine/threonine protein kinase
MAHERWQHLEELFEQAQETPVDVRPRFLAHACAGDPELRREIEAMLAADSAEHALELERFLVDAGAEPEPTDPLIDTFLGPWRLVGILGRGGMGTVYRAERADGQYRQEVAIKLARVGPRDAHGVERFRTERQVLAHLRHPNIASLLDGGFTRDGTPYLVMELVEGAPVTDWCVSQHLTLEARLRLFRVVCDAVQHAHRALVVHRDLKPTNIFVTRSGEVKLLDFGIAKLLDPGAWAMEAPPTLAEMRLLTPEYAAPEQHGDGHVTTATDVYTLGVVLHELITGVRPGGSSNVQPRVHRDLERIVLTALRDEPERRYVSAGQLGEEVGRFLEGRPVLAQPDTVTYRVRTFLRRHRVGVAAAAALVCSLTAFGIVSALQARALAEQGRIARDERDKAERIVSVLVELFEATNPAIRPDGDRMTIGEFLQGAEARALVQLRQTPVVRAKLQQVFGQINYTRGQFEPARIALEEALAAERRLLGPDHPDALESLQALGQALHGAGHDARARPLLQESIDRHRRLYGPVHEKTARAIVAMAPIVAVDDLPKAGAMLSDALAIRRRVLPPQHEDIAHNLAALAEYHNRRSEFDAARRLYEEALAIARRDGAPQSPKLVALMNDYGAFLGGMGADTEAEPIQREAIALARQVLGERNLPVANLVGNLGVTLTRLGRLTEAETAFREGYERHVAVVGEHHWRTRNAARNVGRILSLQQRYTDALPWMDRALVDSGELDPSRDPGRVSMAAQRAVMVFRLGRRDEAIADLTRSVARLKTMTVDRTEGVLAAVSLLLARALNDTGQPARAETLLAASAPWFARYPSDHPSRAEADCEQARSRMLQGFEAEGRAVLARAFPIYRRWGLAEREVVTALERLMTPRVSSAAGERRYHR